VSQKEPPVEGEMSLRTLGLAVDERVDTLRCCCWVEEGAVEVEAAVSKSDSASPFVEAELEAGERAGREPAP